MPIRELETNSTNYQAREREMNRMKVDIATDQLS